MATPIKIIAKARKLYEAGMPLREIAKQVGVSYQTIWSYKMKEDWLKNKLRSKLDQKTEESFLKMAEKLGLTKASVVEKIVELQGASDAEGAPEHRVQAEGNKQAIEVLGLKKETLDLNASGVGEYQQMIERERGKNDRKAKSNK